MHRLRELTVVLAATLLAAVLLTAGGTPVIAQDGDCGAADRPSFTPGDRVHLIDQAGQYGFVLFLFPDFDGSNTRGNFRAEDTGVIAPVDPVCNGGYEFWYIEIENGASGWMPSMLDLAGTPTVVLASVGQAGPPATTGSSAAQTTTASANPADTPIFEDSFNDYSSGWPTASADDFTSGYIRGQYQMTLARGMNLWQSHAAVDYVSDFTAEVDVTLHNSNSTGGLGFRSSGLGRYYMLIDTDRRYTLYLYHGGDWTELMPWRYTDTIRPMPETNRIRVTAEDDTIALYANGELLDTLEDDTLPGGTIELFVYTKNGSEWGRVVFDNLLITQAQPIDRSMLAASSARSTGCEATAPQNQNAVNVRSGPGQEYTVIGSLAVGAYAPVTGRSGSWYAIDQNGREGWVASWVVVSRGACNSLPAQEAAAPVIVRQTQANQQTQQQAESTTGGATGGATGGVMGGHTVFTVNGGAEATVNPGQCATVAWDVSGVQAVYYQGGGVAGTGSRQECPTQTTTYELRITRPDGSQAAHTVRVNVAGGGAPPAQQQACYVTVTTNLQKSLMQVHLGQGNLWILLGDLNDAWGWSKVVEVACNQTYDCKGMDLEGRWYWDASGNVPANGTCVINAPMGG